MKLLSLLSISLIVMSCSSPTQKNTQTQSLIKTAFLEKWENSKTYLLEIAKTMPEDLYDFAPTERQKTFQQQLIHIKDNMEWLSTSYIQNPKGKFERTIKNPYTKAEIINLLENGFDKAAEIVKDMPEESKQDTVQFFSGPLNKLQILNLMQDHVTHHRGQIIVYLNLNGISPPDFVGW